MIDTAWLARGVGDPWCGQPDTLREWMDSLDKKGFVRVGHLLDLPNPETLENSIGIPLRAACKILRKANKDKNKAAEGF